MMSTDTGRYVPMPLGLLFPYLECLYPLCLPKAWWLYRDLFFFFLSILAPHMQHMEVPRLGVKLNLQLAAYTTAHGNAGSPTHWVRPRIELASSWILVRFLSQ